MGELAFVGLGLGDERGLSERALEQLRRCRSVFAEEYTAVAPDGTLDRLAARIGRPVVRLDRVTLESERVVLDALATGGPVALVTVGDPFAATTHLALRLAAERAGHDWSYYPNASVVTAVPGFLGLIPYRFGRIVSVPFPAPGFHPRSPLEQLAENRGRALHTLVLLDLRPDEGRFLSADAGLRALAELDPDGRILGPEETVAVAARVGRPDARGFVGPCRALARAEFGPPMHAIVVPARTLHVEETAALARFRAP